MHKVIPHPKTFSFHVALFSSYPLSASHLQNTKRTAMLGKGFIKMKVKGKIQNIYIAQLLISGCEVDLMNNKRISSIVIMRTRGTMPNQINYIKTAMQQEVHQ